MVSLAGSSDAYMPLDNPMVAVGRGEPIMTLNDKLVYGDDTFLGDHNILIGDKVSTEPDTTNNIVVAENVKLASGVKNVISLGVPNQRITKSNYTEIGSFLYYDAQAGQLNLLNDAIVAEKDGPVQIGGENGLLIRRDHANGETKGGVEMAAPVRLVERGSNGWSFELAASENAPDPLDVSNPMRDLVLRSDNGAAIVFSDQYTPAITNFTGQHRCLLRQIREDGTLGDTSTPPPTGTVLIATGDYCGLNGEDVTVDEAIPIVIASTRARDTRVFGVLSSIEDAGPIRRVRIGNLAFDRPKVATERRVVVNGSGEGGILVCGDGGDIANGDYLCTSSRTGLAMKQPEPYQCTFTCGKATTSVTFDCKGISIDSVMIGCVYA